MTLVMDSNCAIKELSKQKTNKIRYRTSRDNLSIEFKNMMRLNGEINPTFSNMADGSIITIFDKTPFPINKNDVVCPHFVELKWANGCNFDCAWCYLNGTFRFRSIGKKPYIKDGEKIINHVKNYLDQNELPSILNSGELSDSLVFENTKNALSRIILPLFKSQNKHKLLIVTKSTAINDILSSNSQNICIISFSVNSFEVAKRWEHGSPSPRERIDAAKKLYDLGYTIRMRIDPVVPIENWEKEYCNLIDYMFERVIPERITIGSLRGLQSTINNSKDNSWVEYLDDGSNWGKKISFNKRYAMYKYIIEYLNGAYHYYNIGLCKETVEMWDKLGMNYKNIKCNCML